MRPGISIRAALDCDVSGVVAIERGVAEASHWAEAEYRRLTETQGGVGGVKRRLFVAERDGAVVGFAVGSVVLSAGTAELESVAVLPSSRRLGVGKALCEAVMVWCREQGARLMELEVRSASGGARALYEGLGFTVEGVRKAYYREPPDNALLMRLSLEDCG